MKNPMGRPSLTPLFPVSIHSEYMMGDIVRGDSGVARGIRSLAKMLG